MKRRGLFAAVLGFIGLSKLPKSSSIPVPKAIIFNDAFEAESARMLTAIHTRNRRPIYSSLIQKGPMPEGMGFNYQKVSHDLNRDLHL